MNFNIVYSGLRGVGGGEGMRCGVPKPIGNDCRCLSLLLTNFQHLITRNKHFIAPEVFSTVGSGICSLNQLCCSLMNEGEAWVAQW